MAGMSNQYMMGFVIPPPRHTNPQEPVLLPVIVSIRPSMNLLPNPMEQLVLHATLITNTGTVVNELLSGNVTDSIHSREDDARSGYAKFNSLSFRNAGEYRLRVWLNAATETEVVSRQYLDSELIVVHDDNSLNNSHSPVPCKFFFFFLSCFLVPSHKLSSIKNHSNNLHFHFFGNKSCTMCSARTTGSASRTAS
jgi:hypothetical protein